MLYATKRMHNRQGEKLARRVLILGGDGMLGHRLVQTLSESFDVCTSIRADDTDPVSGQFKDVERVFYGADMRDTEKLTSVLRDAKPDTVINAIGIVKQRNASKDTVQSLEINALLPHRIAEECSRLDCRFIHFSTDCVFSGRKGAYTEEDETDALDLYGRTKLLGEVSDAHCITLRSSIIGLELKRKHSLIEWFLAQSGEIDGYRKAMFSGVTTAEMGRVIHHLLCRSDALSGVFHLASCPVSKHDLLKDFARIVGQNVQIAPNDDYRIDRSLNGQRFVDATGYRVSTWPEMLEELASEVSARK